MKIISSFRFSWILLMLGALAILIGPFQSYGGYETVILFSIDGSEEFILIQKL